MLTVNNDRLAFESGRIKTPLHRLLEWKPPAHNSFMIKGFRCSCGANVLHKEYIQPDGEIYVCNGCDTAYKAE